MYFFLNLTYFNKHVERYFLQHVLGTPYSNFACFDKEDIWNFCSFLYSACQLDYFSPHITPSSKLVVCLPQPIMEVQKIKQKTFHPVPLPPKVIFSFRFWGKKGNNIFYTYRMLATQL